MNKLILIGHGNLAGAMKESAEMIFGELPQVQSIHFYKNEGLEALIKKIMTQIEAAVESEILILADLFCGTPYNASCQVALEHPEKNIEVLSGMSLPLVLEISSMLNQQEMSKSIEMAKCLSKQVVQSFREQLITEDEEDF